MGTPSLKTCVVSFADTPFYQEKMRRLEKSLKGNFDGDFLGFTSVKEIGCKPHSEVPYMFKPYAIQKAIDMGYEIVLWCDSPIIAVKPLHDYVRYVSENGYAFYNNIGHPLGRWCNDKALEYFNLTREQAMDIPMIMACCMGFRIDDDSYLHRCAFNYYFDLADKLYPGSWDNHRHDQTVMSALIKMHGLKILTAHETFFMYDFFKDVPGFKIADSVCLVSK